MSSDIPGPSDQDPAFKRFESESKTRPILALFCLCALFMCGLMYLRLKRSRPAPAAPALARTALRPQPGPVADFTLLDQDGRPQTLSGLAQGRPAALYGFSGDCAHCLKEIGRMVDALGSPPAGLAVIGLMHQGTPQGALSLRDSLKIPGSVLADEQGAVCGSLGIGEFTLIVLDRQRRPVFRGGVEGIAAALAAAASPAPILAEPSAAGGDLRGLLFRDARKYLAKDWDPARDQALSPEEEASIPPLIAAVNRRQAGKAREVLAAGADVNAEWRGLRAVHLALDEFNGGRDMVTALLDGGARKDILVAASVGTEEDLRAALASGVDRDLKTPQGKSALHMAVHYERPWAVSMLLDAGAPPDPLDGFSKTPLSWSMQANPALAELLIRRGADVNRLDELHQSPLYYAASYGKTEAARLLIEKGADPRMPGQQGFTPLHMAVQYGRDDIARLLLDHGADPNAKDAHGETPLRWARRYGKTGAAAILEKAGAVE